MKNNKLFMIKMLFSSLIGRRSRIAVALIGVAIGATVLLGMITLCFDVPRQMSQEFRSYGANMVFVPAGKDAFMSQADIEKAAGLIPGDKMLGLTPYRYESVRSNMQPYTAVGTSFEQVRKTSPFWQVAGDFPAKENQVLIGVDIAEFTKLQPGAAITISGRNKDQRRFIREMIVTGIVRTGSVEDGFIFMDMPTMESLQGSKGEVDVVELSLTAAEQELAQIAALIHARVPGLEARLVKRVTQSEASVLSKLESLVYLVTLVVLVLTMICVATTMMTIVMERRKEIGLKKAIGAENRSIAKEFLAEGLVMGVVGGIIGSICGLVFAQLISSQVFGRSIAIEFYLLPITLLVSITVTVVACLIPVRRAVDVEPALVLRGE